NWHCKPKGICPYDQSCEICHPVHPASLTKGFTDFWKFWIEPRCQGHTYTRHTIDYYKEAQESSNCEQVESIFTSLVETIRYQQHIPPASFETLVESLKFYWEITSRFGNWKVLYSNPSDTSSEDYKMIRAPNGSGRVGSTPYPTRSIGSGRVTGQNGSDGSLNLTNQSEEHTSELQSLAYLVCRLLLEKKK